jgi:hypothetical protein
VPANAPQGTYTYCGYIGDYPSAPLDSCYFTFYKSQWGDGNQGSGGNWICSGDPFPAEIKAAISQPVAFNLEAPHPNPFNPTTTLTYNLPKAASVELNVYDVIGSLVGTLSSGWHPAGAYNVVFDGTELASGVYLARLTAGDFTQTQKLVLLK